jgi:hypothetical protein
VHKAFAARLFPLISGNYVTPVQLLNTLDQNGPWWEKWRSGHLMGQSTAPFGRFGRLGRLIDRPQGRFGGDET